MDETGDGDGWASSRTGSVESAESGTGRELLTGSQSNDWRSGEAVRGETDLFVPKLDGEYPALRAVDGEAVEGEADADVVDDGDVEVARVGAQVAVVVLVAGLEDERGGGEYGLDIDVF